MIGTSISMQSSGKMVYPSITICDGEDARGYGKGHFFESFKHLLYGLSNGTKNYTFDRTPDLAKMLIRLSTNMPNGTVFTLKPYDLEDREKL